MFGLIRKKKLLKEMKFIKDSNRNTDIFANYDKPINKEQATLNAYSQGYEDGTDNFYNAVKYKLNKGDL